MRKKKIAHLEILARCPGIIGPRKRKKMSVKEMARLAWDKFFDVSGEGYWDMRPSERFIAAFVLGYRAARRKKGK